MTTILIAGATGLVGEAALALALRDERISRIVAPTRRPLPAQAKLLNPIVTIDALPQDADWWQVDGAICALGTTRAKTPSKADYRAIDFGYPLTIASLVRERGARAFALTSSAGANAKSPFFYTRTKGELEEAVRLLAFPSLTIVRPGFLDGHRAEARPMERIVGSVLRAAAPILPAGARVSPAPTVAAMLVEAAVSGRPGQHLITPAAIARPAARAD